MEEDRERWPTWPMSKWPGKVHNADTYWQTHEVSVYDITATGNYIRKLESEIEKLKAQLSTPEPTQPK